MLAPNIANRAVACVDIRPVMNETCPHPVPARAWPWQARTL